MIIETSANQFFQVEPTNNPDIAHCWFGLPVKKSGGQWVPTAAAARAIGKNKSAKVLVRKAGCRVVEA